MSSGGVSGVVVMRVSGVDRWVHGMEKLTVAALPASAVHEFKLGVEVFFAATQQYAHVLSGDMVDTGEYEVEKEHDAVVGTLSYGGKRGPSGRMVDYVKYELRRKGSHDFYGRGLRKARERLEEATGNMIEKAFQEAMGRQ